MIRYIASIFTICISSLLVFKLSIAPAYSQPFKCLIDARENNQLMDGSISSHFVFIYHHSISCHECYAVLNRFLNEIDYKIRFKKIAIIEPTNSLLRRIELSKEIQAAYSYDHVWFICDSLYIEPENIKYPAIYLYNPGRNKIQFIPYEALFADIKIGGFEIRKKIKRQVKHFLTH